MSQYININSQLDALKIKDIEKMFYEKFHRSANVVPKVTPFKGINTDLLYIKDNKIIFVKFMDTTEELFLILEEDLIEVMNEEFELLKLKMMQSHKEIEYDYIFIMPYVEIEEDYGFGEFVENKVIDKIKLDSILNDEISIDTYLKSSNDEIKLNLFLMDICPEYYTINKAFHTNKAFKKISFYDEQYEYSASMIDQSNLEDILSIKYGNTIFDGSPGTAKTSIMMSRAIKVARIYPHHKFLIFTYSKQLKKQLKEVIGLLYKDNNNLEVYTFSEFLLYLAKRYSLIVDYNLMKTEPNKAFRNLVKQAQNIIKNKNMFKGIFIDEVESFERYEIDFIREFLYKSKFIFNIFSSKSLNIYNNLNIFKDLYEGIEFSECIVLEQNYRQSKALVEFVNNFSDNANSYINKLREDKNLEIFKKTDAIRQGNELVDIIKVSDLDDQISSVIWEIEHLINQKGLKHSEIAIVYPYNKKKLKNGKTIYFQYMLRKALDEANIPYIYADENLSNISIKNGVTISNIYTIKNLEYKAVVLCELEMLYNHTIVDKEQDYQVNDFVGDLNKVYLCITRANEYLRIITTFNENSSDIIKLLMESK